MAIEGALPGGKQTADLMYTLKFFILMQSVYLQRITKKYADRNHKIINPTCRGVAPSEAGSNPISPPSGLNQVILAD